MKVPFRNYQGAGQFLTIRHHRGLVYQHCPNLVFLMEAKAKNVHKHKVRRKLNFQYMQLVPPTGKVGGLALLWSDSSQIQMINAVNNMIDLRILHPSNPTWWRLSCIYGNPSYPQRIAQWQDLGMKGARISEPRF